MTTKLRKQISFVIFILVILGCLKLLHDAQTRSLKEKSELSSVISLGLNFYSPEMMENLEIDSYFFYQEILRHLGKKYELVNNIYDDDLFVRMLHKEKNVEKNKYLNTISFSKPKIYSYDITPKYKYESTELYASALLKTLYCDVSGYDDNDFSMLQTFYRGDGSYHDTHFLIALLFLKENDCYYQSEISKSIEQVSTDIIYAQKNDEVFSDLYAERIVVLYWAGYGKSVEKEWIYVVKSNFSSNSHPHTTGLAILALIYSLEEKQIQPFYVRQN